MATKGTQLETQIDKTLHKKKTNDLATRTHKRIGVELVFSGNVRLSFLLVVPIMLLVNDKSNV